MRRAHIRRTLRPATARVLALLLAMLFVCLLLSAAASAADPPGASIVSNTTETVNPAAAGSSTTAGGSFTTLVLNATTQTPRWKAYVGNATGSFTLRNAANYTIYDWGSAYTGGEVYASRDASPDWTSIQCANSSGIAAEESTLNMSATTADSISMTFNQSVHRAFYVGTTPITHSDCPAIATYINSTAQAADENASFQEVLLQDTGQDLVFASLIDQDTQGFNNQPYDFQMIVPEDEYSSTPHTYYFWLELS